jgi:hypothetical protein
MGQARLICPVQFAENGECVARREFSRRPPGLRHAHSAESVGADAAERARRPRPGPTASQTPRTLRQHRDVASAHARNAPPPMFDLGPPVPGTDCGRGSCPCPPMPRGLYRIATKNPAVIREHVPLFYQATIELSLTRDPIVRQLTFMAARQPLIVAQTAVRKGEQRRPSRRKRRFSNSRIIGLVSASLGEIDVHRSEMGRTCPVSFQGHGLMGINVCVS